MTLVINRARHTREKWFSPVIEWRDVFRFVEYKQVLSSTRRIGFIRSPFQTILVDLVPHVDSIFNGFSKTTRLHIRRAEKESMTVHDVSIDEFLAFYNDFAASAGISLFSIDRFRMYAKHLLILKSCHNRIPLAMAACLLDPSSQRARFFKGGTLRCESDDGNAAKLGSYANRFLHWQLMQRLKAERYQTYDFGGCVIDSNDQRLVNITRFKLGFGKTVVSEDNFCSLLLCAKRRYLRMIRGFGI